MTTFWILAGAFALAAAAFLAYPLWRDRRGSGRWSATGLATAAVTIPAAVLLYFQVTTYETLEQQLPADLPQEQADTILRVVERVESNPDDVQGWRALGALYMRIGQYARARRALQEAWDRTPVKDNALKLSMAEAMLFTERSGLSAEAAGLIEDVLEAEPENQRALWYGGLVALEQGRDELAAERWTALLETNPPPELASRLREQLAQMQGSAQGAGAASGPTAGSGEAAPEGPTIELDVRLGESVSLDGLGSQAALFIFARAPGGGPPIAVIREPVDAVPGSFTLSDADTMLEGRSLADYDELTLVARISASGRPTEQSGDWFAEKTYTPDGSGSVELVIDEVVP